MSGDGPGRMRILYIHQYFVTPSGAGGTRSYEFARRLVQRGHEVTLVTSNALMPDYAGITERTTAECDGFQLVVLPVAYDQRMSYSRRTKSFFEFAAAAAKESMRHDADVVFATSTPLTVALPGLFARLAKRVPLVFEVRDSWPTLPIALGALQHPVAKAAARALEWVAYHGSAQVVALSPGMAKDVTARGFPSGRVTVIPNGCDIDLGEVSTHEVETFRRSLFPDVRADQPLVVYAGNMGISHDPGWLIDVAVQMRAIDRDVRFALVGGGALAKEVEERARMEGVLDRNLYVRPPVPKADVPKLLRASAMATSTAAPIRELEDNSANKFFDALANGVPVALNYGGWQADLLGAYEAGVVLPYGRPDRAARKLHETLRDGARMARLRNGAARLAREHFDREVLTRSLEQVFERAVEVRRAA